MTAALFLTSPPIHVCATHLGQPSFLLSLSCCLISGPGSPSLTPIQTMGPSGASCEAVQTERAPGTSLQHL